MFRWEMSFDSKGNHSSARSSRSRSKSIDLKSLNPVNLLRDNKAMTARGVIDLHGGKDCLAGRTAIVTGGHDGIGLETCKALAYAGCRVILASSSIDVAIKAISDEMEKPGLGNYIVEDTSNVIVKLLDLSDLLAIKLFATEFLKVENRLDFLILNENIMAIPTLQHTSAGFEKHLGINHFGHVYLTSLLQPRLERQDFPSRIIVLTSSAYVMGTIDVKDLHYTCGRYYSPWPAYGCSKLANILYAKKLANQLKDSQVSVVSVHPGIIGMDISKEMRIDGFFSSFLCGYRKTIPQGAASTIWACLASCIESEEYRGAYIADCQIKDTTDITKDKNIMDRLWEATNRHLATSLKILDVDYKLQRSQSLSNFECDQNSRFGEEDKE